MPIARPLESNTQARRRSTLAAVAPMLALALIASACGTRVPRDTVEASAVGAGEPDGRATGDRPASAAGVDPSSDGEAASDDGTPEASTVAPSGDQPLEGSPTAGPDVSAGEARAGPTTEGSPGETSDGAQGEPVRIGSVSTVSGVSGAAQKPGIDGVKVWVQWINDRGGINGHPVEYIAVDDGSDPARHRSAVEDLVENRGVVAFVGQFASQTHPAAREYLEEQQIPVVGGEALLDLWYESPMYFSQGSATFREDASLRWKIQADTVDGEKRAASLVCVEAQICTDAQEDDEEFAPQHGFELVYTGQASLGQPDFTSECLQMRNAGATVVHAKFDFNTVRRVARSCARQSYRPQFVLGIGISQGDFNEDEAFDGSVGNLPVFPFFEGGNAASREYLEAHRTYAPDLELDPMGVMGWVAGKLFEEAAQGIGPDDQPSAQAVLDGLWAMEGETLDGLVAGLTFPEGQGSSPRGCEYVVAIEDGEWVAPNGMEPTCL